MDSLEINSFFEQLTTLLNEPLLFDNTVFNFLDVILCTHAPKSTSDMHVHSYFELNYILENHVETLFEDEIFTANAGSTFLVPPFCLHDHYTDFGYTDIAILFRIEKQDNSGDIGIYDMLSDYFKPHPYPFHSDFLSLDTKECSVNYQADFISYFLGLSDIWKGLEKTDVHKKQDVSDITGRVNEYINTNYASAVHLQDLADSLHISVRHLSRLYRQRYGLSIMDALKKTRIDNSKKLLLSTDLPVKDIARRVGYENESYFSNLFKKTVYVSPANFRNLNRK